MKKHIFLLLTIFNFLGCNNTQKDLKGVWYINITEKEKNDNNDIFIDGLNILIINDSVIGLNRNLYGILPNDISIDYDRKTIFVKNLKNELKANFWIKDDTLYIKNSINKEIYKGYKQDIKNRDLQFEYFVKTPLNIEIPKIDLSVPIIQCVKDTGIDILVGTWKIFISTNYIILVDNNRIQDLNEIELILKDESYNDLPIKLYMSNKINKGYQKKIIKYLQQINRIVYVATMSNIEQSSEININWISLDEYKSQLEK